MRKVHRRQNKTQRGTFPVTIKTNTTLTPVQGVSVSNYLYTCFNLFDTNAPPWSIAALPEFKLYCSMYDRVRINGVKVKVTPKANVFSQDAAQNDAQLTLTGDNMIHTALDRTGAAPGNIKQVAKYTSYKQYSARKKFQRYYGIKYPKEVWLQTAQLATPASLPATPFVTGQQIGLFGGITLYAENFVEDTAEVWNEPWANVELEFYCVFEGKALNSITYDPESGTVSLGPQDPAPVLALNTGVARTGTDTVRTDNSIIRGDPNVD